MGNVDAHMEAMVQSAGSRLLPGLADMIHRSRAVAGLRPYSADEMPLVGRIPGFDNVFLNSGPGHTGWKCSAGFATVLANVAHDHVNGSGSVIERESVEKDAMALLDPASRLGHAITGP